MFLNLSQSPNINSFQVNLMDGILLLHLLKQPILTRFRHREKTRGALAASSSGKNSQALGLTKELERRVEALDEHIQAEVSSYMSYLLFLDKTDLQRQESASLAPYYTEEELMEVYKDVLVVPVPQSEQPNKAELEAIRCAEAKEDQRILSSLEDRLCDPSADIQSQTPKFQSNLLRILIRAHDIVSRVEATRNLALNTESTNKAPNFLPISILSIRECQALVRASVSFINLCYIYSSVDERPS